jgi:hypothetical protein
MAVAKYHLMVMGDQITKQHLMGMGDWVADCHSVIMGSLAPGSCTCMPFPVAGLMGIGSPTCKR